MNLLQCLCIELEFFCGSPKNPIPFFEVINGVPPPAFLVKLFPELLKRFVRRSCPASSLKKTGPCLFELEAKRIAPFRIENPFDPVKQNLFKIVPWKGL